MTYMVYIYIKELFNYCPARMPPSLRKYEFPVAEPLCLQLKCYSENLNLP